VLDTEPALIEQYVRPGRVRIVYRHLLQLGDRSVLLSEYSECVHDQGRFWELRYALYARYNQLFGDPRAAAEEAAAALGVNTEAAGACFDAGAYRAQVAADFAAATAAGIRSRPVFTIGERTVIGAQRLSVFQELLDEALGNVGR
jgi:protein-disulfide isomerase